MEMHKIFSCEVNCYVPTILCVMGAEYYMKLMTTFRFLRCFHFLLQNKA